MYAILLITYHIRTLYLNSYAMRVCETQYIMRACNYLVLKMNINFFFFIVKII